MTQVTPKIKLGVDTPGIGYPFLAEDRAMKISGSSTKLERVLVFIFRPVDHEEEVSM